MLRKIFLILIIPVMLFAQSYQVKNVQGKVEILKNTTEEILPVKAGDRIMRNDIIITSRGASLRLIYGESTFYVRENSAISMKLVRKYTIEDLLMGLAREEVKAVPKAKSGEVSKTTAVYGRNAESAQTELLDSYLDMGLKRMNGAKILADNYLRESAVLYIKETFRKYPDIAEKKENRFYLVNLLQQLELHEEALAEIKHFDAAGLTENEKKRLTLITRTSEKAMGIE